MKKIIEKLNIDEKFTKTKKKPKTYTHIKDNIPLKADYNLMADLLFLPQTEGYKYLLVVVDLATDEFDMEPLKRIFQSSLATTMSESYQKGLIAENLLPPEYVDMDANALVQCIIDYILLKKTRNAK